jgi:hypothetical protein
MFWKNCRVYLVGVKQRAFPEHTFQGTHAANDMADLFYINMA